jgi:flagellar basal body-associated protein FliL
MPTSFERYNDILLDAYVHSKLAGEQSAKKKDLLIEIFQHNRCLMDNVLYVGFGSWLLDVPNTHVTITEISQQVRDYLTEQGVNFQYIPLAELSTNRKQFDAVVAMDEYFTFATNDKEQRDKVDQLSELAKQFIVTTLRDYKNQDFKERDFSYPVSINTGDYKRIYLEQYEFDQEDRNSSLGTSYTITDDGVIVIGPFGRRNMFFKQLAKFGMDAGARNFIVHKNVMYKSTVKRNYEHIITIKF